MFKSNTVFSEEAIERGSMNASAPAAEAMLGNTLMGTELLCVSGGLRVRNDGEVELRVDGMDVNAVEPPFFYSPTIPAAGLPVFPAPGAFLDITKICC